MRTAVRILRGRRRGQIGVIAGELGNLNPGVTKAWVHLPDGASVIVPLDRLARAEPPATQLELDLETQKTAAGGSREGPPAAAVTKRG